MAVDVLHPLKDDTVGKTFEVLVAYNFAAIVRVPVDVKCEVTGPETKSEVKTVKPEDGLTGELLYSFTVATAGDYTIKVTTHPDMGTDTESKIRVGATGDVPIIIGQVEGPVPPPFDAPPGPPLLYYHVSGTAPGGPVPVIIAGHGKDVGGGHQFNGDGKDDPDGAGVFDITFPVVNDNRRYVVFVARQGGKKRTRGRKQQ